MRAWELWGGFERLKHGCKAWGLLGECAEGLLREAVCQGYLRALQAVWKCWGYLEDVEVEVMGLLWEIEGRWELFLSKGLGGSGDTYGRSDGILKE